MLESAYSPLSSLARAATEARSAAELGAALTDALRAELGADQLHLVEIAQDGSGGEATVHDPALPDYGLALDGPSGVAHAVATGTTLHVPDARRCDVIRPALVDDYGVEAALFVPVAHGGEVRRVAIVISHRPRVFDAGEIAHAEALAEVAAAGLARLEAEDRRSARAAHDRALVHAARALSMSLELEEVLRTLAREAALAVGADLSGVYLGDRDGGVATAGHNVPDGLARAGGRARRGGRRPGPAHGQHIRDQRLRGRRRGAAATRRSPGSAPRSPCR